MLLKHLTTLFLCIVLCACTPRGAVSVLQSNVTNQATQRIFVTTTRQQTPNFPDFNKYRTSRVSMLRYDISVPPTHLAGQVEWPKKHPNPATDFVTTQVNTYPNRSVFRNAIKAERNNTDEAVVFIHGYNNTFAEGLYRFAQISHDLNITGNKYHYSWASGGDPRTYIYDRDSVLFARDGLEQMLTDIAQSSPNGFFLVAHSVGAALAMETLRQLSISGNKQISSKLKGVILISPDIDVNVFALQMRRIKPTPQPFLIFASKRDLALRFSSFITGSQQRLGMVSNPKTLKNLDVDLIDISAFSDGDNFGHSVVATSPTLLAMLANPDQMRALLNPNKTTARGSNIVSRVVQIANDATQIILNPN